MSEKHSECRYGRDGSVYVLIKDRTGEVIGERGPYVVPNGAELPNGLPEGLYQFDTEGQWWRQVDGRWVSYPSTYGPLSVKGDRVRVASRVFGYEYPVAEHEAH